MANQAEALKLLKNQIDQLRSGSSKTNARSCTDLYIQARSNGEYLASGNYMIDPNSGSEADSFEVYCNFDNERMIQTCVYPDENLNYLPTEALDQSQLNFLKVNYRKAKQTVTFDCANGQPEITLRGDEEFSFTLDHDDVTVSDDTCSEGGSISLEITSKSSNMPITAVDDHFGYEAEPVCFFA
jgi:hypothetical protein